MESPAAYEPVALFAGGIAHDFNNILSVILTATSFLEQAIPPDSSSAEDVAEIRHAAERAARLSSQLLALTRRRVLDPHTVGVDTVVAGMARMLERMLGADITLELATDPGNVQVDPMQLEQVIMNLALNARDAMPAGGTLRLATTTAQVGGVPHVRIAVSDTGIGMDAATRARIFEPFFTTKAEGKGTGLGLSTVLAIVQQGGGHVRVDSELGRGTTVAVLLPCEARATNPPACDDETVEALGRLGYRVLANAGETLLISSSRLPT